jgi:hypothetical protein
MTKNTALAYYAKELIVTLKSFYGGPFQYHIQYATQCPLRTFSDFDKKNCYKFELIVFLLD